MYNTFLLVLPTIPPLGLVLLISTHSDHGLRICLLTTQDGVNMFAPRCAIDLERRFMLIYFFLT